jgi:anti-sigma factor RsiW
MTCDESKLVLSEYWSHTLGEAEELAFEAHIATCDACHRDAERLGALWKGLALIPVEEPGPQVRTRFYDSLAAFRHGLESAPKHGLRERLMALWPKQPAFQMAVSFALLVVGVGVGYTLHPGQGKPGVETTSGDPQVAQLRGEISNMRQMVALSLLQQQSAGDRLRGVSYAYQVPSSDTQVLSALLATVNTDPNVNVRLAAVDALHGFGGSQITRAAVIQSIRKQDQPMVQIALIDLLVDLHEVEARPELAKLAADDKVIEAVRQHAKVAMEKLQ